MGTKLKIDLSALCTRRVEREGQELRSSNALRNPLERKQSDGSILFTAKTYDAFQFVDHPVIVANGAGTRILEYRCNCPDYIKKHAFCEHCAALALEFLREEKPARGPVSLFDLFPIEEEKEQEPQEQPPEETEVAADLGPASVEDLSYWSCNCAEHLYPGQKNPRIPLKSYQRIFGQSPYSLSLYRRSKSWGGSCSGITFTSAMLFLPDSGADIKDFSPKAELPSQLQLSDVNEKLSMTLHEFVESAQLVQYSPVFYEPRREWMNHPQILETLAQRVADFQATGENPVGMSIYADKALRGGHSVLPYKFERREGDSDLLHIYDPNWPMQTRYAYLEKDAQGQYVNWRFPMTGLEEYCGEKGAISMTEYENFKKVWDNRGSEAALGMMTADQDLTIMNPDGDTLACVTKAGVQSWQKDIFQIPLTDEPVDAGLLLQVPEGQYLVRNDEPERGELTLSFAGRECLLEVNTQARMAEIVLNQERQLACAVISEPGCAFSIEFETVGDADTEQVKLEGITGEEPLCFAKQQDLLCGTGMAWCREIRLYRNGEQVDTDCIRELSREKAYVEEYETSASDGKEDDETP